MMTPRSAPPEPHPDGLQLAERIDGHGGLYVYVGSANGETAEYALLAPGTDAAPTLYVLPLHNYCAEGVALVDRAGRRRAAKMHLTDLPWIKGAKPVADKPKMFNWTINLASNALGPLRKTVTASRYEHREGMFEFKDSEGTVYSVPAVSVDSIERGDPVMACRCFDN